VPALPRSVVHIQRKKKVPLKEHNLKVASRTLELREKTIAAATKVQDTGRGGTKRQLWSERKLPRKEKLFQ